MKFKSLLSTIILAGLLNNSLFALQKPYGVNFGGLYVLEDWFLSNTNTATYVSTPCGDEVANTNEFIINDQNPNIPFTSETDLIKKLKNSGKTDAEILQYFKAHRERYFAESDSEINVLENNFNHVKSLGINMVRLPITWPISYDSDYNIYDANNNPHLIPGGQVSTIVPDPFHYTDSEPYSWASIPASDIEHILEVANQYGIKVLLDIHAYPGGAGSGTFNGVWPLAPQFWTTSKVIYQRNFETIVGNLINWTIDLKASNPAAYEALLGITPMNEPAHLLGVPQATCNPNAPWVTDITYNDVLETIALSVPLFKNTSLPNDGKKLYANIIETMMPSGPSATPPFQLIGKWWLEDIPELTQQDREEWAYLDIHHYFAWDPSCNQCLTKDVKNNIIQPSAFSDIQNCAQSFYGEIRNKLSFSPQDLLATSEFSASANANTVESCASGVTPIQLNNQQAFRNHVYNTQLEVGKSENINMFFWTWKLPYNHNFQNEWSLHTIESQQPKTDNTGLSAEEITAISVAATVIVGVMGYALISMF